nr:immunoglobulin light chain junction region [Macaca mulatta]MOV76622.1 immunoglobulin light chain junction region [Macaca mulatta]MOX23809.1 immunoglobulin light chain junction region [Macaca mulatta]MOX25223.1 immunoglobulin light chain junction region [Macaca mulatta]MOX25574.1 immunoglobulin light chain junction region [Macaca mulatta]
CQQYNSVPFTF